MKAVKSILCLALSAVMLFSFAACGKKNNNNTMTSGSASAAVKYKDGEYKATRPDTDNLQKMLKDCMTKCGFWKDDALVVSEITEKFWAKTPGIFIRIEDVDNGAWGSQI